MKPKSTSLDCVPTLMGLEAVVAFAGSLGQDVTTWIVRNALIRGELAHFNHRESGRRIFAKADVLAWLASRGTGGAG